MAAASQPIPNSNQRDAALAEMLLGKRMLLHPIFHPRAVAVIGASGQPGTTGHKTFSTLISSPFGGTVFAVNSEQTTVPGVQTYPSISAVGQEVDLAVVVTPAETVPEIIGECVQAGVKGAIVLSAGFSERGREGAELEQQIAENLKGSRMRLMGPSSLGVINPLTGLNATPGLREPLGGSVAFLSQSGTLATAVLDWSLQQIVGFSAFVSVGTLLDVGWGDLIDYFGSDPQTRSILIYMESIDNVPSFLSAAREVSRDKPVIVIKAGRTDDAVRAVAWHTAHVAGDDEVLEAAFRRVGVLRVESIDELFFMSDVLSKQPLPKGPRLMVVSNAGAASVLAADSVISTGGELAQLSSEGRAEFDKLRPVVESDDPIDVLGDGSPEAYAKAIEISAKDPNCDGLLLLTLPTSISDPRKATDLLLTLNNPTGKPILACFMGGETAGAQETLARACIPTLPSPRAAARAFKYMWQYSYNLRGIYETPMLHGDLTDVTLRQLAESIIHSGRDSGRTLLTDVEAKRVLAAYRIPTLKTRLAHSEGEALRVASEIGFPAVLKAVSDPVTQEIEFLGMPLTLLDAEAVRRAWRLIESAVGEKGGAGHSFAVSLQPAVRLDGYQLSIGSKLDPQFGPVLRFGPGGKLADVFGDRAVGLPPLNATLARRMMERSKIYTALQGAGRPVDLAALEALLVRFSQLVVEQPWIEEIEINPLLASPQLLALDARVVVHGREVGEAKLPRPAIRPYPMQYVSTWTMKDGQAVTFRPIRAEDEPLMVKFHQGLSAHSIYLRYFHGVGFGQRTAHDPLTRICFIDYDREMALVGEQRDPQTEERRIIALGNLTKVHGRNEAELAAMIRDDYQGRGLGVEMMRRLIRVARDEKLDRVRATTMTENYGMSAIFKRLGFETSINMEDGIVEAALRL